MSPQGSLRGGLMKRSVGRLGWAAIVLLGILAPPNAGAIPAFARKYGLRCSACHEAWPVLNDFGRAFRDNGYQTLLGKDDLVTTERAYIPFSIRLTPQYTYSTATNQQTDSGNATFKTGGVQTIGMDFLTAGALFKNVSFLVVPTGFTVSSGVFLESAWIRFSNIGDSSWLNFKLGRHEVDLPRSAHRPWNLTATPFLFYGYHSPGSISGYDMGTNQRGIEYIGHDRGSFNRVGISIFTVEGTPGSTNTWDTPGIYGHATHAWHFDSGSVSGVKVGAFGALTTWPTTSLVAGGQPVPGQGGGLKNSTKIGAEAHVWLGPAATPVHIIGLFGHGTDNQALIPGATRDGSYNGGYLEAGVSATLKDVIFLRYDIIRNSQQGVTSNASDLDDRDAETIGYRHTFVFSNHSEYALHLEFSTLNHKKTAADGVSDVRNNTFFAGIDFAY
jgi:hypothetical protein